MPKRAKSARRTSSARQVRIRMYNVGFGDCFLLFVPTSDGEKKVLIDCGSIKQGQAPIKDVIAKLIEDVRDENGEPSIDVVIATHRHRDHVSGFASAVWDDVRVTEVWMPWTENPKDPEATRIREAQTSLALQLHAGFVRLNADPVWQELALNAAANESAMATLHDGFRGKPLRRFLPSKDRQEATLEVDVLPGVVVHVMGPSHDEDVIRDMDPPAGKSYLRLVDPANPGSPTAPDPFSEDWALPMGEFEASYTHLRLAEKDKDAARSAGSGLEEALGAALDAAINGTSLMLLFRIGRTHLLFPGDAQWGTWKAALEDREWRSMLQRTVFYKIGHHGSHNATPVEFVENVLGDDFQAMASVKPTANWKQIPRKPLLDALRSKNKRVIRSDHLGDVEALGFTTDGKLFVDAVVPVS